MAAMTRFCSQLGTKQRTPACLSLMQLWLFGSQGCWGPFVQLRARERLLARDSADRGGQMTGVPPPEMSTFPLVNNVLRRASPAATDNLAGNPASQAFWIE